MPSPLVSPSAEDIRAHLERVLAGSAFRGSKRSREFLRFVVERTLEGDGASLKERTLGIEIFGRNVTYDTNNDAIVRVKRTRSASDWPSTTTKSAQATRSESSFRPDHTHRTSAFSTRRCLRWNHFPRRIPL
jgi:hypothetical protein